MMTDYDFIELFSNYLTENKISWSNLDIEGLEYDDDGNMLSFNLYYEEPNIETDLILLKNRFDEKNLDYHLKCIKIKNNELLCIFIHKMIDEQILYY